jgi:hypothetical protein
MPNTRCERACDRVSAYTEELAVRRWTRVCLEQQAPPSAGGIGVARTVELESGADAHRRLPVLLLGRLEVAGSHESHARHRAESYESTSGAPFQSAVRDVALEVLRVAAQEVFPSRVNAERPTVEREDHLRGLERDVLALERRVVLAQQELVAQVRALMVEPQARGERTASHRDRKPDDVIGVDQIVGRLVEIELGEHAALEAHLKTVA